MDLTPDRVLSEAASILEHALGDEIAAGIRRAGNVHHLCGDWCDRCTDIDGRDPVRYPNIVFGSLAVYCCHRCGHVWRCWWALEDAS